MTPFGFSFARSGFLIVSEAFGGAPGRAATSSYRVSDDGNLDVISPSIRDFQTAACWVVLSKGDRFAYVTNTGSHVIAGYSISGDGTLRLLSPDGVTAATGAGTNPIDMALTNNGRLLYVHLAGTRSIAGYRIEPNGGLTRVSMVDGLPVGAQGIAVR
jgi:6-phosphogluconolactonase